MITDCSIEIDAPAALVWDVFTDAARWPTWTASVQRVEPLDGPAISVGKRFAIKQPRMPNLVWVVTEVQPGTSWTWVQRSPGGTTAATHEIIPQGAGRTLVKQRIDQRGPVGRLVGLLTRGMTRRYLDLEANGLKACSEGLRRSDAASS